MVLTHRAFLQPFLFILCAAAAFFTTGCTGFDILNAPVSSVGYTRHVDIPYGNIPRQKLDIYQPRGAEPNAPVVIFFYGGEWSAGEKGNYRFAGEALSSEGFIAVLPDYRLYPHVTFPAFVEDAAKSVRWVHDNIARFGGDPSRIYLMGHSAGAQIAVLLSLDPHYLADVGLNRNMIRATAGLSGPYDFLPYGDDRLVFNMKATDKAPPDAMEPIHFADGHAPPMLFIQGGKDQVVDPSNATEMQQKICKAGGYAKAIIYPDMAHEGIVIALASPWRWLAPVLKDSAEFFREH
ncbi:MAG TPA: alpha/beta hydrolase [Tepidisphaeraceae bacterium]|jgi:acetyl esterase/lipase|nr:alpha/beta hydrolase [Tepidisphaeraceae bacterium]